MRFRFLQMDFKYTIIETIIAFILYKALQDYVSFIMALVIVIPASLMILYLMGHRLYNVSEFREESLVLKEPFKKEKQIEYGAITKATFTYGQFVSFHVYIGDTKIKLPSPGRLQKAEEVLTWLKTKNPNVVTEVLK
jgi:hypothetical protein